MFQLKEELFSFCWIKKVNNLLGLLSWHAKCLEFHLLRWQQKLIWLIFFIVDNMILDCWKCPCFSVVSSIFCFFSCRSLKFYSLVLSAELPSPLNYYKLLLLFNKSEDVSQSWRKGRPCGMSSLHGALGDRWHQLFPLHLWLPDLPLLLASNSHWWKWALSCM